MTPEHILVKAGYGFQSAMFNEQFYAASVKSVHPVNDEMGKAFQIE